MGLMLILSCSAFWDIPAAFIFLDMRLKMFSFFPCIPSYALNRSFIFTLQHIIPQLSAVFHNLRENNGPNINKCQKILAKFAPHAIMYIC